MKNTGIWSVRLLLYLDGPPGRGWAAVEDLEPLDHRTRLVFKVVYDRLEEEIRR